MVQHTNTDKRLEDDIPSSYLDKFDTVTRESWLHDDFRKRILEIISEHEKSSDFIKSVRGELEEFLKHETFIEKTKGISTDVAKDYIDKSRIKTIFWIIGLIVVGVIGLVVQKLFSIL